MLRYLAPFALIALLPLAAQAQEADDAYAPCAAETDNAARLACFDSTYAGRQATVVEAARIAAEQARRDEQRRAEEFGLDYIQRDELRAAQAAADVLAASDVERVAAAEAEERGYGVTANVSEAFVDGKGKAVVLLANGMLWRESSGSRMRMSPREGWVASITRHWSGAYEMRFEGRTGYLRVERLR